MTDYIGYTGPTGITGQHGKQGAVGAAGERGFQGPRGDGFPNPKMQYQSFYVTEGTLDLNAGGIAVRPVFTTAQPPTSNNLSTTILGMSVLTTSTISVPPGTYNIQASSIGLPSTTGSTNLLVITNVSASTNLVLGISALNNGMAILDSTVTFSSQTTLSLSHYSSASSTYTLPTGGSSWTCFISFMRIQ